MKSTISTLWKRLHSLPLIVRIGIAILLGALLGGVMPGSIVRVMNTFCALFSELLGFIIPLIIVGLVTPAIIRVGNSAGRLLVLTALLAYGFTVLSGLFAYGFSTNLFPSLIDTGAMQSLSGTGVEFLPFFTVQIPPLMGVMTALITAFMVGLGVAAFEAPTLTRGFEEFEQIVTRTIANVLIPLLPYFIFGLFLDMSATGKVAQVLIAFVQIILVIFAMTLLLLVGQYIIAGVVTRRNPLKLLWRMLPAYLTALGTSSSAATIPVTLRQATVNGVRPETAGFVIPLCATIHLSGSTLKITSCAIALMLMQGQAFDFVQLLGFILMLGITMVAAPGVPGGAIMAALGVLESILGFDASQQALMISLYIAMDSFGTACNVTGDGAIALIMDRLRGKS